MMRRQDDEEYLMRLDGFLRSFRTLLIYGDQEQVVAALDELRELTNDQIKKEQSWH